MNPGYKNALTLPLVSLDIIVIRCAFEVKIKLEGLAVELAANRIETEELNELESIIGLVAQLEEDGRHRHPRLIEIEARSHRIILQAAQNSILEEFLDNLHYRCARLWSSSLSEIVPNRDILSQMRKIYMALKNEDPDAARQNMERHVQYFIEKIKMCLL
jgi:DNA-binding GntR family transcriptional regulator